MYFSLITSPFPLFDLFSEEEKRLIFSYELNENERQVRHQTKQQEE